MLIFPLVPEGDDDLLEHAEQSRILEVQGRKSDTGSQGTYQRKQQRATKVPAKTLAEGTQQERDSAPLR